MYNEESIKSGYVAIGDAVLGQLHSNEEISLGSLIAVLEKQAMEVKNETLRKQILQGQSLLSESVNSIH